MQRPDDRHLTQRIHRLLWILFFNLLHNEYPDLGIHNTNTIYQGRVAYITQIMQKQSLGQLEMFAAPNMSGILLPTTQKPIAFFQNIPLEIKQTSPYQISEHFLKASPKT